jgi:hypothetical protein
VDAKQKEDEAPSPKVHVPAVPGDCIEVEFISSIEADSIFRVGDRRRHAGWNAVPTCSIYHCFYMGCAKFKLALSPKRYNLLNFLRNAEL